MLHFAKLESNTALEKKSFESQGYTYAPFRKGSGLKNSVDGFVHHSAVWNGHIAGHVFAAHGEAATGLSGR